MKKRKISKIKIIGEIPDNKEFHSMCVDDNDNLYLIGGLNNTVLKYDLNSDSNKQKWIIFKNKLNAQRNHPICFHIRPFIIDSFLLVGSLCKSSS